MSDVDRILDHYDAVLNGSPWHGDPVWQILDGISAQTAAARPCRRRIRSGRSSMHMTFWEGVATQRLAGQRAGLVEELNFPAMPAATEENWKETLDRLSRFEPAVPRGTGKARSRAAESN